MLVKNLYFHSFYASDWQSVVHTARVLWRAVKMFMAALYQNGFDACITLLLLLLLLIIMVTLSLLQFSCLPLLLFLSLLAVISLVKEMKAVTKNISTLHRWRNHLCGFQHRDVCVSVCDIPWQCCVCTSGSQSDAGYICPFPWLAGIYLCRSHVKHFVEYSTSPTKLRQHSLQPSSYLWMWLLLFIDLLVFLYFLIHLILIYILMLVISSNISGKSLFL